MLKRFNDGRSKNYYCIASTILTIEELKSALSKAEMQSLNLEPKQRDAVMHSILDSISKQRGYLLKIREVKHLIVNERAKHR